MGRVVAYYIRQMPYILSKPNFESDIYNNCLIIQRCYKDLDDKGLITDFEKRVVRLYFEGYNTSEVARELKVSRVTVELAFKRVTSRIAFLLGGEFTDAAVLSKVLDTHI